MDVIDLGFVVLFVVIAIIVAKIAFAAFFGMGVLAMALFVERHAVVGALLTLAIVAAVLACGIGFVEFARWYFVATGVTT